MTPPLSQALIELELTTRAVDVPRYLTSGQLDCVPYTSWYFDAGAFSISRIVERSKLVMSHARARGFGGVRICGNLSWLTTDREWNTFLTFEHAIHQAVAGTEVIGLCSYPIRTERDSAHRELMHSHHAVLRPSGQSWQYLPQGEAPVEKTIARR